MAPTTKGILGLLMMAASAVLVAAWLTHIVWIVKALASDGGATFGQIALGVIGAFMPPVGVVHGIIIWVS